MYRLPAITIVAGGLLTLLAITLAVWSKELVKDSMRYECADRAVDIREAVSRQIDSALSRALVEPERPTSVAVRWMIESGEVVSTDPADAGPPPAALLESAVGPRGARWLHLGDPAPMAASWIPREGVPGTGAIVRWDLQAMLQEVVGPEIERTRALPGYICGLLGSGPLVPESLASDAPFRDEGLQTLEPPLSFWQVGVRVSHPTRLRWSRRLQVILVGTVAAWLLGLVVGSVVMHVRRARERMRRAENRSRFLASAYHELQTPLALLRAAAESIDAGSMTDPDDLRRCAAIIQREEERLTFSVRRLLRYLRLENSAPVPDEPAPIARELESVIEEMRPSFTARGLEIGLDIDPSLTEEAQLPRELLGDTVRELLSNVLKHARGATRVDVRVRGDGLGRARISVSDDGAGVASSQLETLFDPFVKAGGDKSGSGLGLSLVREAVGRMGGRVAAARSALGGLEVVLWELQCRRSH